MSRAIILLWTQSDRDKAIDWIKKAPLGCIVEFRQYKRSNAQNSKMWAMLTDVARQILHHGHRYDTGVWKILFMSAFGREIKFIPALDGRTLVPLDLRSSELTKDEMSDLIEFIAAEGSKRGVIFHDHPPMEKEADGLGEPPTSKEGGGGPTPPPLPEFLTPGGS